jgi:ATP synthase protein I
MADREESLEDRMKRLKARLADVTTDDTGDEDKNANSRPNYSQALKLSSEFVSAVVVGAMLGYLLDLILPIKPWGLIVFLLLGFCAGVLNMLRAAGKVSSPHPVDRLAERQTQNDKRSGDKSGTGTE